MSDLNLKEFSEDDLIKRINLITDKLTALSYSGRGNSTVYMQLKTYLQETRTELQERRFMKNYDNEESGVVANIGDKTDDA